MTRTLPALLVPIVLAVPATTVVAQSAAPRPAPTAAAASAVGGALPGGAVLSAAVVAIVPANGGTPKTVSVDKSGAFSFSALAPGRYRLALASNVGLVTQGATFGEKVNQGLHAAGSAVSQGASMEKARHETAKNSVGNIRAREMPTGGMPNRISMNVTIARRTQRLDVDGTPIEVDVGADGKLSGVIAPN